MYSLIIPENVLEAIALDVERMLWSKDELDPDEFGSHGRARPWIRASSLHNPVSHGGIALLNWPKHVLAIKASWALQYADACEAPWKQVLDAILGDKYPEGRGVFLSARPLQRAARKELSSGLPRYWKHVISAISLVPINH